jgi:hypothetical protein
MGYTAWDAQQMATSPGGLEFIARFYTDFYRLLNESGVDGVFFWWYPGGYRLNERSDFGIINPDGTDRPVTRVVREQGGRFLKSPKRTPKNLSEKARFMTLTIFWLLLRGSPTSWGCDTQLT